MRTESVVFLRGVNVGKHKRFRPAELARDLPFDVMNVGAAGTFVVRARVDEAILRAALARALPFEAEAMICRGGDLLALTREEAFADGVVPPDTQRFVSVMAAPRRDPPRVPISHPPGKEWQVKVVAFNGPFALSLWRRVGERPLYPNEVLERALGIPFTTRNWSTILRVCALLEEAKGSYGPAGAPQPR